MTVPEPSRLWLIARDILDTAVLALDSNGIDPPDRRVIAPGEIADDCNQIAVALVRVFTGTPGREVNLPEQCGNARTAEYVIRPVRCVAVVDDQGHPPSDVQQTDDAEVVYRDLWTIHQELIQRWADGTFLDGLCGELLIGNIGPAGPEGGLSGYEMVVQAQVHGV